MGSPVRLFRLTPGAHTLRELLASRLDAKGEVRLTSFSSVRLALCRSMFGHLANVEISEFGKVVGDVIRERSGVAPALPAKGLIVSALSQACKELDEESPFFRVREFAGFYRVLARNWELLRSFEVDLSAPLGMPGYDAAPAYGAVGLEEKARALAALYSRAEQLLTQLGRRFNADAMAACAEMEPEDPPFSRLVVVAGSEYRPAELSWLEWLASTGIEVELIAERHFLEPRTGATLFPSETPHNALFNQADRIEQRLGAALPFMKEANPLAERVFGPGEAGGTIQPAPSLARPAIDCAILETPDVLSECEWVLRDAATRVENWALAAIFVRNLESYGPILEATADRFGAPLSMTRRFSLMATSRARSMLQALSACASRDVRDLMRLSRSSYFPVESLEARKELEEACRQAYRNGIGAWGQITLWSADHGPDWLRELLQWREEAIGESATIEEWRERLISLATLPSLGGKSEVRSQGEGEPSPPAPSPPHAQTSWQGEGESGQEPEVSAIEGLSSPPPGPLPTAQGIRGEGELGSQKVGDELGERISARDEHAVTAMLRSLAYDASIDRISGRRALSLSQFARLCRNLWAQEEVTLEPEEGGIQVVSAAEAIGPVDVLYVMGMLEGEFPRRRTEDALFTDAELRALSPDDPIPDSVANAAAERDEFYRACCAPARALVLSYPRVEEDRDNVPAFYLEEIRPFTGREEPIRYSRARLTPDEPHFAADAKLKAALDEPAGWPAPPELRLEKTHAIARGEEEAYSPKELADAYACPFRFFAQNRLDLHSSHERGRWASLSRLPSLAKLADQPDPTVALAQLRGAADEILGDLVAETSPHDYKLIQSGIERLLPELIAREFRARQLWPRDTVNAYNVGFENGPLRGKLKLRDGRTVQLKGNVPAVSMRGDLEVVHLYKGRDPVADPGAEGEAKIHPHEQLEVDLYLLMRDQRDRPVGIEIDHARGRRLITLGTSEFPRQDVKSEMRTTSFEAHERSELLTGMVEKIQIAVDRIQRGDITPMPEETRCHFCDYGELCRRSHRFSEVDDPFALEQEADVFSAD